MHVGDDRNSLMLDMCYKRGSGGRNVLVILERKIKGKKAKGRLKIMIKHYGEVKRNANDRVTWRAIAH